MDSSTRRQRRKSDLRKKRRRTRRRQTLKRTLIVILIVAICCAAAFLVFITVRAVRNNREAEAEAALQGQVVELDEEALIGTPAEADLAEAERLADMYDYDAAIEYLQNSDYYDSTPEYQAKVDEYNEVKDNLVAWEPENVTHIFFHTLIVDPSKAWDDDEKSEGYNQYMVTIDEFSKIINTLYDEGYVMVSMHDMCEVSDDGKVTRKDIYLPEGKTPFVISQDDVSYYHYMGGDGFADKLVLDENGNVKCEYIEDDGSVSVGDYDLVPWIDTFVEAHPDFSYLGHKGTIALTGYEGVLGYRTDEVYRTQDESRFTSFQRQFFIDNPDFDEATWEQEVADATAVADAMKAEGWEFASHTWGHIYPLGVGLESFEEDTEKWIENVEPIVGPTDIIIFAFGADITSDWTEYPSDNEYFRFLKDEGFDIFCVVDSSQYYVQFNGESLRMGRRNIDGFRMYYNPGMLQDLFEVDDVWDKARPDEVAPIG
ncbi:MAG: polysaccharide deacetylase [Lachnospiraceae bacterium]|nr:polysaccharide deacetylase [Lachnospiraceae bacterium]